MKQEKVFSLTSVAFFLKYITPLFSCPTPWFTGFYIKKKTVTACYTC